MRNICGYEGLYSITEDGSVWSHVSNRFLKPRENHKGYLYVNLYNNKRYKSVSIHRLVAQAYVKNPDNLPQVNHKDGNKMNNNYSNLEWCTNSANLKHAYKNGLRKSKLKLSKEQIIELRRLYNTGKFKLKELAEMFGYKSIGNIYDLIHHYRGA